MAKQVLTIDQTTRVQNWVAKFATNNAPERASKIEAQAALERDERDKALELLVESGLDVTKALKTLRDILDSVPEKPATWGDKIRAAQVMIDFAKYLIPPEPEAKVETTQKMSIRFEDYSDSDIAFFLEFGHLPSAADKAKLQDVRGRLALPGSRTSEGTETTPTLGSHLEDNK